MFSGKLQDGLKAIEEGLTLSKEQATNQDLKGLKQVGEGILDFMNNAPNDHANKKQHDKKR